MEEFLDKLSEILDVAPSELAPSMELDGFETWDSLAAVSFTAMADVEYNKKLNAKTFSECTTIEDLYRLIAAE